MRRLLPLLGVVALLVAGCGGSSTTTQEHFAAQVKAVCAEYDQRAGHEIGDAQPVDPADPKTTPLEIAHFAGLLGRIQLIFHRELAALAQVEPSASAKERYATFLDTYRQVDAALAQAARAARKGDRKGTIAALSRIDGRRHRRPNRHRLLSEILSDRPLAGTGVLCQPRIRAFPTAAEDQICNRASFGIYKGRRNDCPDPTPR